METEIDEELIYDLKIFQTHICPSPFVSSRNLRWLRIAQMFKEFGTLPRKGGYLDQYFDEIKAVEMIAAAISEAEDKDG